MPDLVTDDLESGREIDPLAVWQFAYLLETCGLKPIENLGIVMLLKKHNDARLQFRRYGFYGGNAEVIGMLMRYPNMRDMSQVFGPQNGLGIKCPAVVECLALEPGIASTGLHPPLPGIHWRAQQT